jgi:hypothetical protein
MTSYKPYIHLTRFVGPDIFSIQSQFWSSYETPILDLIRPECLGIQNMHVLRYTVHLPKPVQNLSHEFGMKHIKIKSHSKI